VTATKESAGFQLRSIATMLEAFAERPVGAEGATPTVAFVMVLAIFSWALGLPT
jgi:hypothetical protein